MSAETKWTPGPWIADGSGIRALVRAESTGVIVAVRHRLPGAENEANACLIAAAPEFGEGASEFELYEAAVVRGDDVAAMRHYARAAVALRNALAKARGEI